MWKRYEGLLQPRAALSPNFRWSRTYSHQYSSLSLQYIANVATSPNRLSSHPSKASFLSKHLTETVTCRPDHERCHRRNYKVKFNTGNFLMLNSFNLRKLKAGKAVPRLSIRQTTAAASTSLFISRVPIGSYMNEAIQIYHMNQAMICSGLKTRNYQSVIGKTYLRDEHNFLDLINLNTFTFAFVRHPKVFNIIN